MMSEFVLQDGRPGSAASASERLAVDDPFLETKSGDATTSAQTSFISKRSLLFVSIVAFSVVVLIKKDVVDQRPHGSEGSANSSPSYGSFITPLGPESLTLYSGCDDLRADLMIAVNFIAQSKIESDAQWFYHLADYDATDCVGCFFQPPDWHLMEDGQFPFSTSYEKIEDRPLLESDHMEGVDEADVVKSDGQYAYAAYGNSIVVWDIATLAIQSRTELPTMGENYNYSGDTSYGTEDDETGDFTDETNDRKTQHGTRGRRSAKADWCTSFVQSMVLTETCLVVIVYFKCHSNNGDDLQDWTIMMDAGTTRVFVYDTTLVPNDGKSLTLLSETSLQGVYASARAIDSNVHIVTKSLINKYYFFTKSLDRFNFELFPQDLSESEYRTAAQAKVDQSLPLFVDALIEELKGATHDDSCTKLARYSLVPSSTLGSSAMSVPQLDFTGDRVLPALTLVTSFDVADSNDLAASPSTSTSGIFLGTSYSNVYASPDHIIVAGQGWNQGTDGEWYEDTVLVRYRFSGTTSTPTSIGHVPGYLLVTGAFANHQFSMDYAQSAGVDYLRVATGHCARWKIIQDVYGPKGWHWEEQESECSSRLTVLAFPADDTDNCTITVVGQLNDLGVTGTIDAVRFVGDYGFVVTSHQTDPYYTLDLSDPFHPILKGEMNIPGFGSYLHAIGEDLILAVGQNMDEGTGQGHGLSITLFNVTTVYPQIIQQYFAEEYENNRWSYMDELYDHRAFRYLDEWKVLIVPVVVNRMDVGEYFDGFIVYNIDVNTGISRRFRIDHTIWEGVMYSCSSDAYVPPRIIELEGEIMTLKSHTVVKYDLESQWRNGASIDLDANYPPGYDCGSTTFFFH